MVDPASGEAALRRGAALARAMHPALPRIVTVGDVDGRPSVVWELVEGRRLRKLTDAGPLDEAAVVRIGRGLAGALAELHRLGLAHGQVTLDKVLLTPAGDPRLAQVELEPGPAETHADLYALGAVLFECAAGGPPEGAATARDLNPAISPLLSAVVARLLATDPATRYPSAEALLEDLALVAPEDEPHRAPAEPLAGDVPSAHRPRRLLAGRRVELEQLRRSWQAALHERGQMVLLRGPLGSGKTHLARAFLQEVESEGRVALFGRCDEGGATPFGALRSAIDDWLRQVARLPATRRSVAEQRLRIAGGDLAPILKRFSPALDALYEDVPAAPETDLVHDRFYDILAQFLLKLAGCYGGLVLCTDAIQWLDTSSREVLRRIGRGGDAAPLLLLGTLRTDRQVPAASSRTRLRTLLANIPRVDLRLAPLPEEAVRQMVAALLAIDDVPVEIGSHVSSWTGGNPLAVREYVESLLAAGVLRPEWGQWVLDSPRLEHLELSRDVADLLAARVGRLVASSAEILSLAALLGSAGDVALLRTVAGDDAAVDAALRDGVEAQILRRGEVGGYRFSHDTVRAALTEQLSEAERAHLHQRIADALAGLPADGQLVYAIARHAWLGEVEGNAESLYERNLAAGLAAMNSFAGAEAYEFLQEAQRAAAAAGIAPGVALEAALGELCVRTGRWDEALEHLHRGLQATADVHRRAALRCRLARVYVANRNTERAWEEVEHAFREMGTPLGRGRLARVLYTTWCWLVGLLSLRVRLGYGAARGRKRERLQLLSQVYVTASFVAYLSHDRLHLVEMVVRQLYTGHLLGDSTEMSSALTGYAMLLAVLGRQTAAQACSERSLAMAARLGDRFHQARVRLFDAWQIHVGGFPRRGELAMRRCLQADGPWLDTSDTGYGHIDLAWNLLLRGYAAEALTSIVPALDRAQLGSGERDNLEVKAAAALAVLGRTAEALDRLEALGDPSKAPGWLREGLCSFLLLALLEQGELGQPLEEAIGRAHEAGRGPRATVFHGRHLWVFVAYARLEQCMRDRNRANLRRLGQAVADLRRIRRHPTIDAHYLAVRGALLRLEGKPRKALRALTEAEARALRADNVWALFHVHRQMAHVLAELDNHDVALRQAHEAHRLAVAQGWANRARLIRSEFNSLRPAAEQGEPAPALHADAERDPERLEQHLEALLQVSLAASATLDPVRQAQVALDELLRVLQAQRAFLFTLTPFGELQLRAGRSAGGEDLMELTGYSRSVVETVRSSGEPVMVAAAADEAGPEGTRPRDLRSIAAAPLLMKGELLGVVYVDTHLAAGAFTDDDGRILTAIANHIAIALSNASAVAQQAALTRANADLLEALRLRVSELQESRRQITAAEERLRRDIAEMLHSRVQSKLLVAAHQLGEAATLLDQDPEQARRLLQVSQEQLDDVREREVRDASHLLHPSIIKIGLAPAVRSLISRFDSMFEVSLEVDPRLTKLDNIVDNQLPEELRLTAYRAIEEALGNIARHAQASSVAVSLAVTRDDELFIAVRDDGVGFDSNQLQSGLGLSSIDGRVNQMGGRWQIVSQPGQGAAVEVRLPLDREGEVEP